MSEQTDEELVPALGWYHISYSMIRQWVHCHIQEATEYPGLRFVWTLDPFTNERTYRFFIGKQEYPSLNEAIKAWKQINRRKRVRLDEQEAVDRNA